MTVLMTLLLLALTFAPLVIAFRYGDRILDALSRRSRQRRKTARRRRTRSLPIRDTEIERLLGAEERRDQLDESIASNLEAFGRLPGVRPHTESEAELEAIERAVLDKESQFGSYLDYAWLQSETLEVLTEEARLLRQLAELPEEGLPISSESRAPAAGRTEIPQSAADKLFTNLQRAQERRSDVDRKLESVGRIIRQDRAPETGQAGKGARVQDEAASEGRVGGTFDATIGDDTPG